MHLTHLRYMKTLRSGQSKSNVALCHFEMREFEILEKKPKSSSTKDRQLGKTNIAIAIGLRD